MDNWKEKSEGERGDREGGARSPEKKGKGKKKIEKGENRNT
jgi:hypothetical protein